MKDATFTGCLNERMEYASGPGGSRFCRVNKVYDLH